jgi:hypothetical protein
VAPGTDSAHLRAWHDVRTAWRPCGSLDPLPPTIRHFGLPRALVTQAAIAPKVTPPMPMASMHPMSASPNR